MGFNSLLNQGVSGLPVVDEKTGALVDTISISDLRVCAIFLSVLYDLQTLFLLRNLLLGSEL